MNLLEVADELQQAFGANARDLREALEISQEEFAARCQLGRAYYGRVERGQVNVTLHNMYRIATGLGVPISKLVKGVELNAQLQEAGEALAKVHKPSRQPD